MISIAVRTVGLLLLSITAVASHIQFEVSLNLLPLCVFLSCINIHLIQLFLQSTVNPNFHIHIHVQYMYQLEIETKSENKRLDKDNNNNVWLRTNPEGSMYKNGYKEGTVSRNGLTFRNEKQKIIACTAAAVSASNGFLLKGTTSTSSTPPRFQPKKMTCLDEDNTHRFLQTATETEPTALAKSLATPHGYGGWMPFNPNLHMVNWPHPVAAYMVNYQGVYGCVSMVNGGTDCPHNNLIGPFLMMQSPMGSPFFLPSGPVDTRNMPFVPGVPAPTSEEKPKI